MAAHPTPCALPLPVASSTATFRVSVTEAPAGASCLRQVDVIGEEGSGGLCVEPVVLGVLAAPSVAAVGDGDDLQRARQECGRSRVHVALATFAGSNAVQAELEPFLCQAAERRGRELAQVAIAGAARRSAVGTEVVAALPHQVERHADQSGASGQRRQAPGLRQRRMRRAVAARAAGIPRRAASLPDRRTYRA